MSCVKFPWNKREMRKYTPPEISGKHKRSCGATHATGYLIHAEIWKEYLVVNVFSLYNFFTLFVACDGSYITLDRATNTWKETSLFGLMGYQSENDTPVHYVDEASEQAGAKFFYKDAPGNMLYRQLGRKTLDIIYEKQKQQSMSLRKICERDKGFIDYILEKCVRSCEATHEFEKQTPGRELDEKVKKWCDENVMKWSRYGYAERDKRDRTVAHGFCSHCGSADFKVKPVGKLTDNEGKCKRCGAKVKFKNASFNTLRDRGTFTTLKVLNDGIAVMLWNVTYIHRRLGKPESEYSCFNIEYISFGGDAIYYTRERPHFNGFIITDFFEPRYEERRGWYYYKQPHIGRYKLCTVGLAGELRGTPFENTCIDKIAKSNAVDVGLVIRRYLIYPAFESAAKLGFYRLCNEWKDAWNDCSLKKCLGLDSAGLAMLYMAGGGKSMARMIATCKEYGIKNVSAELLKRLDGYIGKSSAWWNTDRDEERLVEAISYCKRLDRLCDFLKRAIHRKKDSTTFLGDYYDYLNQCKTLHLNLKDYNVLFPAKFDEKHRELSALIEYRKSVELDKMIADRYKAVKGIYEKEIDGYVFKCAKSSAALIAEGKALSHCVGRYADDVAEGKCVIVFCRKKEHPKKPYCTAEFRDGKSIQFRAFGNGVPDKATLEAYEKYKKYVQDKWNKKEKEKKGKKAS